MQPTIARWHTRYRVAGEGRAGIARIENGVRERMADAYVAALHEVFGNDPAVYVLRRVQTELTVVNPSMADEPAIARAWGERTCAAVVRTVIRDGDDPSLVMRFEDTAAFVAQWIADLLDGVAWDRWYYGAFSKYRSLAIGDALRAVLLDHREHLAAILRRLSALRRLQTLLDRLPPESARELWRSAVRGDTSDEPSHEQFRLFVRVAIDVADALLSWTRERPAAGEIFPAYVATSPRAADWTQPRALAQAVFAVLAFLQQRGFLRIDAQARLELPRLREVVGTLEWLDDAWLFAAIEAWLRDDESREVAAARPPEPTPLQRRIVDVLRRLAERRAVIGRDDESTSERYALVLFAALASEEPSLAAHPAAPSLIETFITDSRSRRAAESELRSFRAESAAESISIASAFAGVFLLSRAILDARLTQLAEALGIPVPSLLLSLASEWNADVGDAGVVLWSGLEGDPEPLDPARHEALRAEVVRFMRDRAAFAPSLAPDVNGSIAGHLLRLWAHWLPGLAQSSATWLLQQMILRPGMLRINASAIAVSLAPAPLDVVLEMAGYFAPIASLPWLAERRVTFMIDRSLQ